MQILFPTFKNQMNQVFAVNGGQKRYKFCSYTTNTKNQSANIKLSLPANKKITIFWGDGTSTVVTGEVTTTTYSHTYADVRTYNLTVTGDYNEITYLQFDGDGSYGGDIKYMPDNLIYFRCLISNTFTGDIQYFPIRLIYFKCDGFNTIYGDLQYSPQFLVTFQNRGRNIILGDLKYLSPAIKYFLLIGYNTVSAYTGKTWTTNMSYFRLEPVSPGGLSSAEMDQLLIDLDEDLDWSGGGTITLTGTNAPRTSASDDAVNSITAAGGTVITN